MRSEGEGRLSGTPAGRGTRWGRRWRWREDRGSASDHRAGAEQVDGARTDKPCVQQWSQTQRTSFTTVASTFRLPKIPFTDWLSLIKRMSPVLLARYRTHPAMWGSVWKLCRGGFPMGQLLFACILPHPATAGQLRQRCFPEMPLHCRHKEGKLHPLPVLASLLSLQTRRTPSSSLLLHVSVQRFS